MNLRSIAVIFTCHNRKEKTIRCLETLHNQKISNEYKLLFVCCDDGSTDGTTDAILSQYPETIVVYGTGDLFWAKGMAIACKEAQKYNPDYYLMVNDDVDFYNDMVVQLLNSYKSYRKKGIEAAIVGATCNANGERSYGGFWWDINRMSIRSRTIFPSDDNLACNIANWNCFLIPREIYLRVGEIDSFYEHGLADFDYSFRITKNGYSIYSTNLYIGVCENNPISGTWKDTSLPPFVRIKLMQKRTAKPWRSDVHFFRKIVGARWPIFMLKQYLALFFSSKRKHKQTLKNKL